MNKHTDSILNVLEAMQLTLNQMRTCMEPNLNHGQAMTLVEHQAKVATAVDELRAEIERAKNNTILNNPVI